MAVTPLNRTLDQEVLSLFRGASLECLVCGEFVLRTERHLGCPECGSAFVFADEDSAPAQLQFDVQAG